MLQIPVNFYMSTKDNLLALILKFMCAALIGRKSSHHKICHLGTSPIMVPSYYNVNTWYILDDEIYRVSLRYKTAYLFDISMV